MTNLLQPVHRVLLLLIVLLTTAGSAAAQEGKSILVPELDGPWIQIAPNAPDVGEYKTGKENACDFTIFKSDDGKWHCISCIRGTSHFGQRLFYHWTTDHLASPDWTPVGMFENIERGTVGKGGATVSVQAPHHVKHGDKHYLFYNSYYAYCLISDDGTNWSQHKDVKGDTAFFRMGRDIYVMHDEDRKRWIAYYTGAYKDADGKRHDGMVARTAPTPEGPWSEDIIPVRTKGNPESPFVVKHDGRFYLWQQMSVYVSDDPLDFNDDESLIAHMTGKWFDGKYAPEVIRDGDDWYVTGYSRGIHLAKMRWVSKPESELAAWRPKWSAYLAEQARLRESQAPATTSPTQ
ncbi:MAG TPA: hypothetical protein VGN72_13320 [Tepidisphaeraceae bacterium]|jgi:hypothetical protein|nr:hypothetical protein [Tepidisphaeraceae bacterium]